MIGHVPDSGTKAADAAEPGRVRQFLQNLLKADSNCVDTDSAPLGVEFAALPEDPIPHQTC